ncbi:MAG TPA: C40 family peptidase [Streptosporangiaceae bacterium]|nr:C40 family peptidase [Streptosporangiaceae bacterium]
MGDRPGPWLFSSALRHMVTAGGAALLAFGLMTGALPAPAHATNVVPPTGGNPVSGIATGSGSRSGSLLVPVAGPLATAAVPVVAPLRHLDPADLIVIAQHSLPRNAMAAIEALPGVTAAASLDAARIKVNGNYVAMIGVDPSSFRSFAARPTASSNRLWQDVAAGGIAVSYDMGKQAHLPLGGTVHVAGRNPADLHVAGFATAGIGGIDAVVSHQTAMSVGLPAGNAIVISAPNADLTALVSQIKRVVPKPAAVQGLVYTVTVRGGSTGGGGAAGGASVGGSLTGSQVTTMLRAAVSRQGMPYLWGGSGPTTFDCSGLVQWSFARAGIAMPRVAADQARTGPLIPFSQAQPGDLMFWHTDPTAPNYISHVAIYLGNGQMIQAPEPGENVEVVPVSLGSGFAGAVQVHPLVANSVAA